MTIKKYIMTLVAIVDDKESVLQEHTAIVNQLPGFEVIGQFTNGIEIIKYCKTQKQLPDIILMDIEMPRFDGVQTTDYLTTCFPQIKILGVSIHTDEHIIIDLLSCGAYGYIFKSTMPDRLKFTPFKEVMAHALLSLAGNREYIDERFQDYTIPIRKELMALRQNEKEQQRKRFNLTKIEEELILLSGANLSYHEFAEVNNKSPRTVETQRNQAAKKLSADKGQVGLFAFSLRNGLIKMATYFKRV